MTNLLRQPPSSKVVRIVPTANPASVWARRLTPIARDFLDRLLALQLVTADGVEPFLEARCDRLPEYTGEIELGFALVDAGLLTNFQLDRVLAGSSHGLLLGNYRVLNQIGSGGMGQVFDGEHRLMKRRVAIKVLPVDEHCHGSLRHRFFTEMRVLAELHHPNVVQAFDAGELLAPGPNMPTLVYLVMELVTGGDLEQYVEKNGALPVAKACDWIRQAAEGLQAAHDRHVVHRDVKPSNLLRTTNGEVKLVDFGLARQFCSQLTDPRALLGSVEFMAPEQSHDPSGVGTEADIYGLGATLFWLLTGEAPYPFVRNVGSALRALQREPPRRLRALRPDAPPELEAIIDRMLERDPCKRLGPPLAVSAALAPFTVPTSARPGSAVTSGSRGHVLVSHVPGDSRARRTLIAAADPVVRNYLRQAIEPLGCHCREVGDGASTLAAAGTESFGLVLLQHKLPGADCGEVARRLRERSGRPSFRIILFGSVTDESALAAALGRDADDYLVQPIDLRPLLARVERSLRSVDERNQAEGMGEQLRRTIRGLEQSLSAREADIRHAHDALLFTMAKMAESRDGETPGHLRRLQRYVRVLAVQAAREAPWAGMIDSRFLDQVERCVPLHDIGKIGLPDDILLKPASLTAAERALVETHPLVGDRILEALGKEHGEGLEFLGMARAIVRHHHEHYDGNGYPDRLAGDAIPAAARLVAVADVYDALRRERLHKPAMSHSGAARLILGRSSGQFDPCLLRAFELCQDQFERIYREVCE